MRFAYRVIWNSSQIKLSTPPKKLSTSRAQVIHRLLVTLLRIVTIFPWIFLDFWGFMSVVGCILIISTKKRTKMNDYTLYQYTVNGKETVSAIHWRDGATFRAEHPDAIAIR
jgi:hypothetical protein